MSDRGRAYAHDQQVLREGTEGRHVDQAVLLDHEDHGESDHIHDPDVGNSGSSTCIICG